MLYHCLLTLHDNVFFATREMGVLYETEKVLHNWALSYAFFSGTHIPQPYRVSGDKAQRPCYLEADAENSLHALDRSGIYVFPAKPLQWSYQINTFKAAQSNYYGRSKQFGEKGADRNYPINFGRAKELAAGSRYRTYIVSEGEITLPRWIRLGKWAAKVRVEAVKIPAKLVEGKKDYTCDHPLNPLDLPPQTEVRLYDRVVMPPVSLFGRACLSGEHLSLAGEEWKEWQRDADLPPTIQPYLPPAVRLPHPARYGARYAAGVA